MTTAKKKHSLKSGTTGGYSLAEVVMAVAVTGLLFGGLITGYVNSTRNAEWSGLSMAAESLSVESLEQARAAVWDPTIPENQVITMLQGLNGYNSNATTGVMTAYYWTNLNIPVVGGNYIRATNFITVTPLTISSGVTVQMIQVNTVWPFQKGHSTVLYTNTTATYMAPDNRSPATL